MNDKTKKSEEFRKLQKKWYDKLKSDGFEDIEWVDHNTGEGQNSRFLKNSLPPHNPTDKKSLEGTLASSNLFNYYRLARNFLHNYNKFNNLRDSQSKRDKRLWELHSDGATYREISKDLRRRYKTSKLYSVYWVYYRVQKLQKTMTEWNATSPEGLKPDELNTPPTTGLGSLE